MFSNYCGLGGSGSTKHETDKACKQHDRLYSIAQKLGGNPYWTYIKADKILYNRLKSIQAKSTKEALVRYATMAFAKFKQHALPHQQEDTTTPPQRLRKRPIEVSMDPVDTNVKRVKKQSLSNMTDTVNSDNVNMRSAAATSSDGSVANGGETSVDQLNYAIYRPFPRTHQVLMPYHSKATWSITTADNIAGVFWSKVRLNSIYDIFDNTQESNSYVDVTPGTDTIVSGAAITQPQMREFWQNFYRYYHVVATRYKVTVNMATVSRTSAQAMAYVYLHGQQEPPRLNGAGSILTHSYRQHHPQCQFQGINSNAGFAAGITFNGVDLNPAVDKDHYGFEPLQPNTLTNSISFTGKWHPGMINHDVVEDDNNEIWTLMTKTPTQFENLSLMIQQSPYSASAINMSGTVFYDIEYIVQLKDLDVAYQYIGDGYDIAAITSPFQNRSATEA